ncbi:MAG: sulfurtransferase TusA family protein [Spirochaetes bacterium]|nr:sulfurtransferase TusA family protein [Spirochaetota bacterium]
MTEHIIDARGLSCPQPVVLTRKAIDAGLASFEITVSSEVSKENVLRALGNSNYRAEISRDGDDIIIKASK